MALSYSKPDLLSIRTITGIHPDDYGSGSANATDAE